MRISFITLGCKVNQYETQAMEQMLLERGHVTAQPDEVADAVIVNTCAVTGESARKSRQAIRRAKKLNPNALVAVCGCFSQSDMEQARSLGADYVGGAGERKQLVDFICGAEGAEGFVPDPFSRRVFEELPAGEVDGHTRALLKVQDGCVNFCSYCIIPYLRGPSRSLSLEKAATAAKGLTKKGYREIVLTGIEISSYGTDIGSNLAELTETVCNAAWGSRVRLGSLEPSMMTEEFVRRIAKLPNLCPHFHLSLQSGSEGVLKRMRRKYTPQEYARVVGLLRQYFTDPAITTDIIFGFPGETEAEFNETLSFMKQIGFTAVHIFPYSAREGTKAAQMPDQVPKSVKALRTSLALEVAHGTRKEYLTRQHGRTLEVLFETERDGYAYGHSENYIETRVEGSGLRGRVLTVKIVGDDSGILLGEVVE